MSSGKAALVRLLKSANETLKNGDAREALRLANEAVAMDETAYEAWVVRGKCAAANGDAKDAVTSYERAIGIKSDHPAAYQGLTETYEASGDVEGRLRATRVVADAARASGKIEKYYECVKKACAYAWEHRAWTRVVEFCGELGTIRASDASCADEETRVESLRRACVGALALRDARAAEAGDAAVRTLRSTTIASKSEEAAVRLLGKRASYAEDDETLCAAVRAWLAEDAANATFDAETHLAEYERLFARLTAALSSSVECDFDVKTCARETLAEASRLVNAWGDVALERVAESPTVVVAALELGLDCEEEGWDDAEGVVRDAADDEALVVTLLEKIRDANAIANAWLTLRETRRSGAFAHSCRAVDAPRDAAGLLPDTLRDDVLAHLSREDETRPTPACAVVGWLALAESALVGSQRGDARALECAATAMKLLRDDVTADALPKTTRRVVVAHAEAMMVEGMFERANDVFTEVEGPRAMRGAATCALHAHPPERARALDILTAATNAYPTVPRVRVERGWLMTIAGGLEHRHEALRALEEACGTSPGEPLAADVPADACARLGVARWRADANPRRKGPGSAHEALMLGAARGSPYRAAAFALLGLFLAAAGDSARARKCRARALALRPDDPTAGPIAFTDALAEDNLSDAIAVCHRALAVDTSCAWAANRLSSASLRVGDFEDAARALRVVLRASPDNAGAWEALGSSYASLGRHTAALKAFERASAVSNDETNASASARAGWILETLGRFADAATRYETALTGGVELRVASLCGLARARMYEAREATRVGAPGRAAASLREARDAATAALDAAGAGADATPTFWKLLGDVHHLTARINDPTHGVRNVEAMLADRRRAASACVEAYERALNVAPASAARRRDVVVALSVESDILRLAGDDEGARLRADEARTRAVAYVERAPGDARAWRVLASSLGRVSASSSDAESLRDARTTALERAVALEPTFADAWCDLGRLRLSSGDVAGAGDALDRARIADPNAGDAWTATAALHLALDRLDDARGAFRMAAALGAGFEAELGFALASCATSPSAARDAYACARRARERVPNDATATVAAALCAESRGAYDEAAHAARDAMDACAAGSMRGGVADVASRVAEACLARCETRRRAEAVSAPAVFDAVASSAAASDSDSSIPEEDVDRIMDACAALADDETLDDSTRAVVAASRAFAASLSSRHAVVVAALDACPLAVPLGDYRAQSALALARAACALNASPRVGAESSFGDAIRSAGRAAMLHPASAANRATLQMILDRRRGVARDEPTTTTKNALFDRLSRAVDAHVSGDSAEAESVARRVSAEDDAPVAAAASARLLLASFLMSRAHRDDDDRPRKEARKVCARVIENESAMAYDSIAGVARALGGEAA